MGNWSQKADADVGKNMGDRPAGSPVQPCETGRKIESLFVPPESVAVASEIKLPVEPGIVSRHDVPEEPGIMTRHTSEDDPAIETAHSTVTRTDG